MNCRQSRIPQKYTAIQCLSRAALGQKVCEFLPSRGYAQRKWVFAPPFSRLGTLIPRSPEVHDPGCFLGPATKTPSLQVKKCRGLDLRVPSYVGSFEEVKLSRVLRR